MTVRAERQSNAELTLTLRNRVRDETMEPDRCKEYRGRCQHTNQCPSALTDITRARRSPNRESWRSSAERIVHSDSVNAFVFFE